MKHNEQERQESQNRGNKEDKEEGRQYEEDNNQTRKIRQGRENADETDGAQGFEESEDDEVIWIIGGDGRLGEEFGKSTLKQTHEEKTSEQLTWIYSSGGISTKENSRIYDRKSTAIGSGIQSRHKDPEE